MTYLVLDTSSKEMAEPHIKAIAREINEKADGHQIGDLQRIRSRLKRLSRRPGQDIFTTQTIGDGWAFHHGGRRELQFHIGIDDDEGFLDYGVGFSFARTQTLQEPLFVLLPKLERFNRFITKHPNLYSDMRQRHYPNEWRGVKPQPIPKSRVKIGDFLFLGKRQRLSRLNYELVLRDFDRLLPLYLFVEGGKQSRSVSIARNNDFVYCSGCSEKKKSVLARQAQREYEMVFRHYELQIALHRSLEKEFGDAGTECRCSIGTKVDVAVRHKNNTYWFYEIKTASTPRGCIREAIGQLLEYAYWPGGPKVKKLFVVGESEMDEDGTEYLRRLKKRFRLPIEYKQFTV